MILPTTVDLKAPKIDPWNAVRFFAKVVLSKEVGVCIARRHRHRRSGVNTHYERSP